MFQGLDVLLVVRGPKLIQGHDHLPGLPGHTIPDTSQGAINIENADKVNKINKAFSEIQKEVQQLSKGPVLEPQKNNQVISVCKNLRGEMKGGI
uniref:Uncharacterized protein n=1 Tax=Cairina moschata TaxID=8855 RepID=A0A8C3GEG5_CAIMO